MTTEEEKTETQTETMEEREARVQALAAMMIDAIPHGTNVNDVLAATSYVVIEVCNAIGCSVEAFAATMIAINLLPIGTVIQTTPPATSPEPVK